MEKVFSTEELLQTKNTGKSLRSFAKSVPWKGTLHYQLLSVILTKIHAKIDAIQLPNSRFLGCRCCQE